MICVIKYEMKIVNCPTELREIYSHVDLSNQTRNITNTDVKHTLQERGSKGGALRGTELKSEINQMTR